MNGRGGALDARRWSGLRGQWWGIYDLSRIVVAWSHGMRHTLTVTAMTHTDAAADLTDAELIEMFDAARSVMDANRDWNDACESAFVTCDAVNAEQARRSEVAFAAAMDIARSNFSTAIDQSGEFESTEDAIDSYWENALDTAHETGVDSDAVNSAYSQLVAARAAA